MVSPFFLSAEPRFGAGLTEAQVRRLQEILRREGEEVSLEETWTRAIEILNFAKLLLEALPESLPSIG